MTGKMDGMEETRTLLGERVRIARLQRGWSKEHASRVAGISSITWKRVEDGLGVQDHKRWAVLTALELDDRGYPILDSVVEPESGNTHDAREAN